MSSKTALLNHTLLQPADAVRTTSHATQLDGYELFNIEHTFGMGVGSFCIVHDVVGTLKPLKKALLSYDIRSKLRTPSLSIE